MAKKANISIEQVDKQTVEGRGTVMGRGSQMASKVLAT